MHFLARELGLYLRRDRLRHLVLHVEHVAKFAVPGVRPDDVVHGRVRELRRDAQARPCLLHTPRDRVAHAEFA